MVICDHEAIVMIPEVRDGKEIEDFVGEGRDNRWLSQVFNSSLRGLDLANAQSEVKNEP